jgi:peptide/nickel transport system permease protein/oligopeptide transport system permease protein
MLKKNKTALFGCMVFAIFCIIAVISPIISPYDPLETHLKDALSSPSLSYLLGTDHFGRDILSRLIYGCRVSLFVGIISTFGAMSIGVTVGAVAGYFGGRLDIALMRLVDLMMAIPMIMFALGLMAFVGVGTDKVIFVLSICISPPFARIVRSKCISVISSDYVLAAKCLGLDNKRIIFRHILPNIIGPIIVLATLTLGSAIILEATLSFLGLGVTQSTPTLGNLVAEGRSYFRTAPYLVLFSGLSITLIVLGVNLFGDGLRDALDPRMRVKA